MPRLCLQSPNLTQLLEEKKTVIPGITGFLEEPFPFFGSVEGLAGKLPIQKVYLLAIVSVRLHNNVLVLLADPFDFLQSGFE